MGQQDVIVKYCESTSPEQNVHDRMVQLLCEREEGHEGKHQRRTTEPRLVQWPEGGWEDEPVIQPKWPEGAPDYVRIQRTYLDRLAERSRPLKDLPPAETAEWVGARAAARRAVEHGQA